MPEKTVVIIDDETAILDAVKIVLSQEGFAAITHDELPEAGVLAETGADIILLDLRLGNQDGAEFCKTLKKHAALKHVPVILLSAHAEADIEKIARECDADGYLAKPFDIDALVSIIQSHT